MGVVSVVHLQAAGDSLVPAGLYGSLERVSVVEMLHGLAAKVDAELLELAGPAEYLISGSEQGKY